MADVEEGISIPVLGISYFSAIYYSDYFGYPYFPILPRSCQSPMISWLRRRHIHNIRPWGHSSQTVTHVSLVPEESHLGKR